MAKKDINEITNEAVQRSFDFSDPEWRDMAIECLRQVCLTKYTFTADDVRDLVSKSSLKTHDNRAMGGVLRHGVKMGWSFGTRTYTTGNVNHKSLLQIWKSLISNPDVPRVDPVAPKKSEFTRENPLQI